MTPPLSATVLQYTALSDGRQMQYTDSDARPEYNSCPILSPDDVSYCSLYINGVLQPPANYRVTKGLLLLTTADCPPVGAPVVLEFVTLFGDGCPLRAADSYYVARAAAAQTTYKNRDALPVLSTGGIPSAQAVTFQQLFINGALQPATAYTAATGLLALLTEQAPPSGCLVILHSVSVYCDCLYRATDALLAALALQDCAAATLLRAQATLLRQTLSRSLPPAVRQRLHSSALRLVTAVTQLGWVQLAMMAQLSP